MLYFLTNVRDLVLLGNADFGVYYLPVGLFFKDTIDFQKPEQGRCCHWTAYGLQQVLLYDLPIVMLIE